MRHTNEPFDLSLNQQSEALSERMGGLVRNLTGESWFLFEGEWYSGAEWEAFLKKSVEPLGLSIEEQSDETDYRKAS